MKKFVATVVLLSAGKQSQLNINVQRTTKHHVQAATDN